MCLKNPLEYFIAHPYVVVNISEQAAIRVAFGRMDQQYLCQSCLCLLQFLFRQRVKGR